MYPETKVFWAYEQSGVVVMARVEGWDGSTITQATLSGIAYEVLDANRNKELTGSGTPAVADTVFDEEQFNNSWPWSAVGQGFNFRYVLPASCFPRGGHQYRAEFTCTPASGEVFHVVCDMDILELYGK